MTTTTKSLLSYKDMLYLLELLGVTDGRDWVGVAQFMIQKAAVR